MNDKTINNKGKAIIFKNPHLEKLTRTRPWVIYSIYIPLNTFFVFFALTHYQYTPAFVALLFAAALLSWTLFEYIAHRFLFHLKAKSELGKRLVYIFHENHHEFPRDTERLFMPPIPSIIMATVIFSVFACISLLSTGSAGYAMVFFSGFITGYLAYVSMHYAIHAYAPPKYFKALWRNHHLHHYKCPEKAFGVSSVLWDKVFGTVPNKTGPTNII
jgi:sterol desaturase/sphingolipid hydroxylase (fatty acid hydroxylase superfamily)